MNDDGSMTKKQIDVPVRSDVPPKDFTSTSAGSTSGSESIRIGMKEVSCKWVEARHASPGGQIVSKTWYSAEVPGYIVRMTLDVVGFPVETHTTIQVTEFRGA